MKLMPERVENITSPTIEAAREKRTAHSENIKKIEEKKVEVSGSAERAEELLEKANAALGLALAKSIIADAVEGQIKEARETVERCKQAIYEAPFVLKGFEELAKLERRGINEAEAHLRKVNDYYSELKALKEGRQRSTRRLQELAQLIGLEDHADRFLRKYGPK